MLLRGSGDDALARCHGRAPISTLTHLAPVGPLTRHPATAVMEEHFLQPGELQPLSSRGATLSVIDQLQ